MFQCLPNYLGEFSILTVVGFDGACISKNEDSHYFIDILSCFPRMRIASIVLSHLAQVKFVG